MSNKSINIYGNRHPKRGALVANPIPPENVFWYDIFQPIVDAINKLYTGASKPYKSGDGIYLKADGTINLTRELFSTINGNSILQGAKDIKIEAELPNFKTINGESIIGEGDIQIELPEGILTQGDNNLFQNVKFISVKSQDEETDQFGDLTIKKDFSEIEQYIYKDGYSKNFIGKDNVYFIKDSNEISGANTPSDGTIYKQGKKDIELGSTNGKMKLYSYSSFSIESLNNKISLASKGIQITSSGEIKVDASDKKIQIYDKNLAIESSTNVTINTPDFLIRDSSANDVFRAKNDIVYVKRRFEIEENNRGNTLKLKSDGFEVMTQSSNSAQAILKMTAGGNPFDIRTTDDGGNNIRSEIFIKKPTNASAADYYPIYIRGIGGYDGDIGTTLGAKSLQEIINDGSINGIEIIPNGEIIKYRNSYSIYNADYDDSKRISVKDTSDVGINLSIVQIYEGNSIIFINNNHNKEYYDFLYTEDKFIVGRLGYGDVYNDDDYQRQSPIKNSSYSIFYNLSDETDQYNINIQGGGVIKFPELYNIQRHFHHEMFSLWSDYDADSSNTYINSAPGNFNIYSTMRISCDSIYAYYTKINNGYTSYQYFYFSPNYISLCLNDNTILSASINKNNNDRYSALHLYDPENKIILDAGYRNNGNTSLERTQHISLVYDNSFTNGVILENAENYLGIGKFAVLDTNDYTNAFLEKYYISINANDEKLYLNSPDNIYINADNELFITTRDNINIDCGNEFNINSNNTININGNNGLEIESSYIYINGGNLYIGNDSQIPMQNIELNSSKLKISTKTGYVETSYFIDTTTPENSYNKYSFKYDYSNNTSVQTRQSLDLYVYNGEYIKIQKNNIFINFEGDDLKIYASDNIDIGKDFINNDTVNYINLYAYNDITIKVGNTTLVLDETKLQRLIALLA